MLFTTKARIISYKSNFTKSENDIAEYILDHFNEIAGETISSLAEKIPASEASLVRFCKKIGFNGFNKFKIAIAQECYAENNSEIMRIDASNSILKNIAVGYHSLLNNMYSVIDELEIIKLAQLIHISNYVNIFCSTDMKIVGMELESRLDSIGIRCKLLLDNKAMMNAANQVQHGDLCIFIVRNISVNRYKNVALTLKKNGAKIAIMTQYFSKINHQIGDAVIVIIDKIIVKHSISLSNNLMMFLSIDVLLTTLLSMDRKYVQNKNLSDSFTNDDDVIDSYYFSSP